MAGGSSQLAAEIEWLRHWKLLAERSNRRPLERWNSIVHQVEKVLHRPELARFLTVLEKHNSTRKTPFLLGPHLFQVVGSVEDRRTIRTNMPVLNRPPAEVRAHLQEGSAKSKALARLLRKGPHPGVALAARNHEWEAIKAFAPLIQSSKDCAENVPLAQLLERAAASLDFMAHQISRAKSHRQPLKHGSAATQQELRLRAASLLAEVFRRALNHPYHSHVAVIATLLSGINTNADYVKKSERREPPKTRDRGQNPSNF
jgi:hypothetical protein